MTRRVAVALVAAFGFALLSVAPVRGADVEVGERAGEAIGSLADAVRDFRLTSLPSDLRVQAQSMVFDYRNGELVYKGDVQVQHGEVRLHADTLKVEFEPKKPQQLRSLRADGNVRVEHESETASGRIAVYDPNRATITLTGDAKLGSGPNTVEGEKVVVFLDEGRAVVEGGASGPVRAYIEPKSDNVDKLLDSEKAQ